MLNEALRYFLNDVNWHKSHGDRIMHTAMEHCACAWLQTSKKLTI